jgi:hypothetical protein
MARKRPMPTPGSDRATKGRVARAVPTAAEVRERDRRRAAQRARIDRLSAEAATIDGASAPTDKPTVSPPRASRDTVRSDSSQLKPARREDASKASPHATSSRPEQPSTPKPRETVSTPPNDVPVDLGGEPTQDVEGLESDIAWLLASLKRVTRSEPEAKSVSEQAPELDLELAQEPEQAPAPEAAAESLVVTETEPKGDVEGEDAPADDRGALAAAPTASPDRAPTENSTTVPANNAVPNDTAAWMSGVLARGGHEETVSGSGHLLRGWLQPNAEREPPRRGAASFFDSGSSRPHSGRGLLVGLVVLLVTVLALGAIVWKIIGIGHGTGRPSTEEAGSGATQTPLGLRSMMTVTSQGGLVGVMHLLLDHPIPSLTVKVLTPVPGTSTADFHPTISQLTMTVDGQPTQTLGRVLRSGNKVILDLPPGAQTVDLSYQAEGVFALSRHSVEGRGTLLLTPMIVVPANHLYGSISVHSPDVSNLGCSIAGDSPIACGTPTSDGWRVTAPPGQGGVNVIAQFTLPAP